MDGNERRRVNRVPHLVEIRYASNCPVITARMTDLSETGIFVDVSSPLPDGAMVHFSFALSNTPWDKPITGSGRVVWRQEGVGMGIEFVELSDEQRTKVNLFVSNRAA